MTCNYDAVTLRLHAKQLSQCISLTTSSPKGNDAHLRATIQSEKKWKDQFFRCLTLWYVVGSGRISNSSKLLCMSSLPVSMKTTQSRTTEKNGDTVFQIITL